MNASPILVYTKYYLYKIPPVIKLLKKIPIIKQVSFNLTIINKKKRLKNDLIQFNNVLYFYLTSKMKLLPVEQNEVLEDLYNGYIDIINRSLSFNKEFINLKVIEYCYKIHTDYLNSISTQPYSCVYLNDFLHIKKLKVVLKTIYDYSRKDDYFTKEEFFELLTSYKANYFNYTDMDKFRNTGKIPKRLKIRKEK